MTRSSAADRERSAASEPSEPFEPSEPGFEISGELTIQTAATYKDLLLAATTSDPDAGTGGSASGAIFGLGLSGVTELDTAGLQLLLMVRRELAQAGRELALVGPSAPVRDMLALAGLDEMLGAA